QYVFTPRISEFLQRIEANKHVLDTLNIPPEIETNIRRQSILKSSLFSARIEGNPLTLDEITRVPSKDQKKVEIYNILKGLQLIQKRGSRDVTLSFVKELHSNVMQGLTDTTHRRTFRTEVSANFNTAGSA